MISEKAWSFLKRSWEYIVLGVGILVAYLVYMDPDRVEDFDRRDGKLEGKSESEQERRQEARKKKEEAQRDLDRLREEEKELEEKLSKAPQHQDKTKKELRDWIKQNYGS